jgi:hypothetical protein
MRRKRLTYSLSLLIASFVAVTVVATPVSAQQQPNIIRFMGDDIGIWNTGAYHRGLMAGRTPNLDQLAAEGMMFTDYYDQGLVITSEFSKQKFIATASASKRGGRAWMHPGDVAAPTREAAEAVAVKQFGLSPEDRNRIVIQERVD